MARSEPLQSGTTFLDVEVSLVLPLVSKSQAKRLTKIQAFSLAQTYKIFQNNLEQSTLSLKIIFNIIFMDHVT